MNSFEPYSTNKDSEYGSQLHYILPEEYENEPKNVEEVDQAMIQELLHQVNEINPENCSCHTSSNDSIESNDQAELNPFAEPVNEMYGFSTNSYYHKESTTSTRTPPLFSAFPQQENEVFSTPILHLSHMQASRCMNTPLSSTFVNSYDSVAIAPYPPATTASQSTCGSQNMESDDLFLSNMDHLLVASSNQKSQELSRNDTLPMCGGKGSIHCLEVHHKSTSSNVTTATSATQSSQSSSTMKTRGTSGGITFLSSRQQDYLQAKKTSQVKQGEGKQKTILSMERTKRRENKEKFWGVIWPALASSGWTLERGKRKRDNDYYYIPPNVCRSTARYREDYFDSMKSVLIFLKANPTGEYLEILEEYMDEKQKSKCGVSMATSLKASEQSSGVSTPPGSPPPPKSASEFKLMGNTFQSSDCPLQVDCNQTKLALAEVVPDGSSLLETRRVTYSSSSFSDNEEEEKESTSFTTAQMSTWFVGSAEHLLQKSARFSLNTDNSQQTFRIMDQDDGDDGASSKRVARKKIKFDPS